MSDCDAEDLSEHRAVLETILEQIDREQELVDSLEADVTALGDSISNLPPTSSLKFCAPPSRASASGVDSEIRLLNADIASLAVDRRAHQSRLETHLQSRAQLQAKSSSSQHLLATLNAEFASGTQRLQKAQTLLARLRKSKTGREAGSDLEALLARVRATESRIADVDRELENRSGRPQDLALASMRSQNRSLRDELILVGNRYERLRAIAAKRDRKVPTRARTTQSIDALLDALDRRRVRVNRDFVSRRRAALEIESAQFYSDQNRLMETITAARVSAHESEELLVREIRKLRLAVASLTLK
jgi:hypothetical protein